MFNGLFKRTAMVRKGKKEVLIGAGNGYRGIRGGLGQAGKKLILEERRARNRKF